MLTVFLDVAQGKKYLICLSTQTQFCMLPCQILSFLLHMDKVRINAIKETYVLDNQGEHIFSIRGGVVVGIDGISFGLKKFPLYLF